LNSVLYEKATTLVNQSSVNQDVKSLLFSKYQRVNNRVVSDFISAIPNSFLDAACRITHSPALLYSRNDRIINDRKKLQAAIDKFQSETGTVTTAVRDFLTLR